MADLLDGEFFFLTKCFRMIIEVFESTEEVRLNCLHIAILVLITVTTRLCGPLSINIVLIFKIALLFAVSVLAVSMFTFYLCMVMINPAIRLPCFNKKVMLCCAKMT